MQIELSLRQLEKGIHIKHKKNVQCYLSVGQIFFISLREKNYLRTDNYTYVMYVAVPSKCTLLYDHKVLNM